MRRRREKTIIGADEHIARYAYTLGNVPASIADRAYAAAYAGLPAEERHAIVSQLRAQLPVAPEDPASDDPEAFAALMRNLHARHALVGLPEAGTFAAAFVASSPIAAYFTTGAGSVTMDHQPPWVHDLAGHETAPIDGGRMHHRRGANLDEWYGR